MSDGPHVGKLCSRDQEQAEFRTGAFLGEELAFDVREYVYVFSYICLSFYTFVDFNKVFFLLIFFFIFQKTEEGWKKKKFKEKKPDKGKFVTPGVNQKNQAKMKRKAPSKKVKPKKVRP